MCLTVAVAHTGLAIAAADARCTLRMAGREPLYRDYGGKLIHLGTAAIATMGDACYSQVATERLIAEGASRMVDVLASLARTALMADAEIARRWPGVNAIPHDRRAPWSAASNGTAFRFSPSSVLHNTGRDELYVQGPADGFPTNDGELAEMIGKGSSQYDAIRAVALSFANVADGSPLVSPVVEMSVGRLYLTGNARELSRAFDGQLHRALTEPPPPAPSAHTKILEDVAA